MEFQLLCSALISWVGASEGYKTHWASPHWLFKTELTYCFLFLNQLQH